MDGPALGVLLHMIGGLAAASFYIPYGRVKKWSWETYWLVGGLFSWIIMPWLFALFAPWALSHFSSAFGDGAIPDLPRIFSEAEWRPLIFAYLFGAMWGVGGLTFGLTMRYLGISLGMAIALGYCAAFGTLMPPIVDGQIMTILTTAPGIATLIGVAVCLSGIALTGMAGMAKERELPEEKKRETIKEFSFFKGLLMATMSGVLSAGMAYGFRAGEPIAALAAEHGVPDVLKNLPVLCVILAGGFTTNFVWCVALNIKNGSARQYVDFAKPSLWLANLFFAGVAGTTWYLQFFFYGMGETKIGEYKFSSWTLHMASIIIFSTCWGIILHEWRGSSRRTFRLLASGLVVLLLSMVIVGVGNYLKTLEPKDEQLPMVEEVAAQEGFSTRHNCS
jgi:L-rhamnose-H+ transport protein